MLVFQNAQKKPTIPTKPTVGFADLSQLPKKTNKPKLDPPPRGGDVTWGIGALGLSNGSQKYAPRAFFSNAPRAFGASFVNFQMYPGALGHSSFPAIFRDVH